MALPPHHKPAVNTSTRATFKDANHAHASTARGPLIRPDGIVMPSTTTSQTNPLQDYRMQQARLAHWHENPEAHCATLAACYREALNDKEACLPVTPALITSARLWLLEQFAAVAKEGFWPLFLNGPQPLENAIVAFRQPVVMEESPCHFVPVSADNNGPHPVWSPIENLIFRFVHDYAHFTIGAPATFKGELAVARHTLTPAVRADEPLARFLASESVGQVALSIVSGTYPAQIIAAGILELI